MDSEKYGFRTWRNVIRAVRTWLREQETSWYREGMHALVLRSCKSVDVDGDYVKNSSFGNTFSKMLMVSIRQF
jgi:hypothetical protein